MELNLSLKMWVPIEQTACIVSRTHPVTKILNTSSLLPQELILTIIIKTHKSANKTGIFANTNEKNIKRGWDEFALKLKIMQTILQDCLNKLFFQLFAKTLHKTIFLYLVCVLEEFSIFSTLIFLSIFTAAPPPVWDSTLLTNASLNWNELYHCAIDDRRHSIRMEMKSKSHNSFTTNWHSQYFPDSI